LGHLPAGLHGEAEPDDEQDSLDFKSQIWTSEGRTIILALFDGWISQANISSVRVDIDLNNPTGATVTPLTATQEGFVCVAGCTFSSAPRQHASRHRGLSNKGPARGAGRPLPGHLGPNGKCLFISTRSGTVLTYCFPGPSPTGSHFLSAESAVNATLHHLSISSLVLSPDNQYLFTTGEDSCIYMMKIISSEPQNLRGAAQIQYSEDVLISRSELVE
jgi:WD40 repeat protein